MLNVTTVASLEELQQVYRLSLANLKRHLSVEEQKAEGFVTWLYSIELLEQLHALAPSVIVKEDATVVAYALTALTESSAFHNDLKEMFQNLQQLMYKGRPLSTYHFYCMGQICIDKQYRGRGIVNLLYQKHKEVYGSQYDFILTEISTSNYRSLKAHEKIGFKKIYTHSDAMDEWNVVVWDWK